MVPQFVSSHYCFSFAFANVLMWFLFLHMSKCWKYLFISFSTAILVTNITIPMDTHTCMYHSTYFKLRRFLIRNYVLSMYAHRGLETHPLYEYVWRIRMFQEFVILSPWDGLEFPCKIARRSWLQGWLLGLLASRTPNFWYAKHAHLFIKMKCVIYDWIVLENMFSLVQNAPPNSKKCIYTKSRKFDALVLRILRERHGKKCYQTT